MSNLAHISQRPSNEGNVTVAANVRAELGYSGLSQGDLARALSVSDMAMTRRLNDKYAAEFCASEIVTIAEFFGIEPGELFKRRTRSPRPVGPGGFEPPTSTVEYGRLATVTPINRAA